MDRNFAAVQADVLKTPALADVRLVSVSFDPANDTPAVLKAHARTLRADPAVWHFVTAGTDDIAAFAARFGVTAVVAKRRAPERAHPQPEHRRSSTRTARLVKIRPGQLLDARRSHCRPLSGSRSRALTRSTPPAAAG